MDTEEIATTRSAQHTASLLALRDYVHGRRRQVQEKRADSKDQTCITQGRSTHPQARGSKASELDLRRSDIADPFSFGRCPSLNPDRMVCGYMSIHGKDRKGGDLLRPRNIFGHTIAILGRWSIFSESSPSPKEMKMGVRMRYHSITISQLRAA